MVAVSGNCCSSSCCGSKNNDDEKNVIPLGETSKPPTVVEETNPIVVVPPLPEELVEFEPEVKVNEDKVRLRKEVRSLTPAELVEIQWAFHLLQNSHTKTGENRFFRLARLHTLYCQHWQYSFLPWHRRYLDEFEEELREVYLDDIGKGTRKEQAYMNLSLPFWSWASIEDGVTDKFDVPRVFLEDEFERNGQRYPNSLKQFAYAKRKAAPDGRGDDESNEELPSFIRPSENFKHSIETDILPELVETMRNEVAFMNEQGVGRIQNQEWSRFNGRTFKYLETGFAYHLEITAGHNSLHMLCRGDMGHPWWAAFCPIFWFHHNNIERLWRIWQDQHPAMRHPPEFSGEQGILPGLTPRPGTGKNATCEVEIRGKPEYHFEYQSKEWALFFGPRPKSAKAHTRHRLTWTDLQLYDAPYSFHVFSFKDGEAIPREFPGITHERFLTTTSVFQRPCLCSDAQKQLKLTLPSFTDVSHRIRRIYGEVDAVPESSQLVVYPQDINGDRPDGFVVKGGKMPFLVSKPFIASLAASKTMTMAPTFRRNVVSVDESKELSKPGWNTRKLHQKWKERGKNVRVAVIDTGIDPELRRILQLSPQRTVDYTITDDNAVWKMVDSDGHGTYSTSIIKTIAPDCEIYVAKALTTHAGTWKPVVKAINWAMSEGCHVLCLALGSDYSDGPLSEAIHKAISKGLIVVAAAGNDADGVDYPGRYGSCLCIGAHDKNRRPAPISSEGAELDFLAPGKDIQGFHRGGSRINMTGSSVACAHVAGLSALILSRENKGLLEYGQRLSRRIKNSDDMKEVFKVMCNGDEFNAKVGYGAIVPDE